MTSVMKRVVVAASAVVGAAVMFGVHVRAANPPCDPGNGSITLPAGFCAAVVADNLGPARHIAVAPNGDVYVALMTSGGRGAPQTGGGVAALRDADGGGQDEGVVENGSGKPTGV